MKYLKSFKTTDTCESTLGTMKTKIVASRFDFEIFTSKFNSNSIVPGYLTCIEFDYNFIRALAEKLIEDEGNRCEEEDEFIESNESLYTMIFMFTGCSKYQYTKLIKYLRDNKYKKVIYINKIEYFLNNEEIFVDILVNLVKTLNTDNDILLNSKHPYIEAHINRYLEDIELEKSYFDSTMYLCNDLIKNEIITIIK